MEQALYTIEYNRPLSQDVFELGVEGSSPAASAPGQFAEILLPGAFLRRPFSVCSQRGNKLGFVYAVKGTGTELLSALRPGTGLDILAPLGSGFNTAAAGEHPLLIAGGLGFTPLYRLAQVLTAEGITPTVLLGFKTASAVVYEDPFRDIGADTVVVTEDGSKGERGLVTDVLNRLEYSYVYSCGPLPMLRAVGEAALTECEFSLEARMGCGFGACMGCSIQTAGGMKRVCKDGPVFKRSELIW